MRRGFTESALYFRVYACENPAETEEWPPKPAGRQVPRRGACELHEF
jgi:hypothetical protein